MINKKNKIIMMIKIIITQKEINRANEKVRGEGGAGVLEVIS